MSTLPRVKTSRPAEWERGRLLRWLREWSIEQRLLEDDAVDLAAADDGEGLKASSVRGGAWRTDAGAEGERHPMAGQIRLLFPDEPLTWKRPVYVAVLEGNVEGFVVAPFSRFAEPAFEGEILTERPAGCLRVLCLWNAVELTWSRAERSWYVDELSERDRRDGQTVRDCLRGAAALPPEIATRCGPPLRHPADPRAVYREQERAFALELGEVSPADGSTPSAGVQWPDAEEGAPGLMAAETREPYGTSLSFQVAALGVHLRLTGVARGNVCALQVTDGEGRPSAAADGCRILSRSGRMSRPIARGETLVPGDSIYGGFRLLTDKGETLAVRPG